MVISDSSESLFESIEIATRTRMKVCYAAKSSKSHIASKQHLGLWNERQ